MVRAGQVTLIGFGLVAAGCATLFGSLRNNYEAASLVENPAISGQVAVGVNGGTGDTGRSSVRMQSYDKKSGKLCFAVTTPNPESAEKVLLAAYNDLTAIEARQESGVKGEKPLSVKTISTSTQSETFESTEQVTHRDSSGQVIATSERPVTKSRSFNVSQLESCYSAKSLSKASKYLGLEYSEASIFGEQTVIVAAWRFQSNALSSN